jgi:hypothetical protein
MALGEEWANLMQSRGAFALGCPACGSGPEIWMRETGRYFLLAAPQEDIGDENAPVRKGDLKGEACTC